LNESQHWRNENLKKKKETKNNLKEGVGEKRRGEVEMKGFKLFR
jgi:hypothetical protein